MYWTVIGIFWLSFTYCLIHPCRPQVVMYAASCDIASCLRSHGARRMQLPPLWISAKKRGISPFQSQICTWLIPCCESGLMVPPRYWPNIPTLGLSIVGLDFSDIRWGSTMSGVGIDACALNISIPFSMLSILPHRPRYREIYTSLLAAGNRRIIDTWLVDCRLGHLCLCRYHLQEWVYPGSLGLRIVGIGRFHGQRQTVRISDWILVIYRHPRVPTGTHVCHCRHLMTFLTCWVVKGHKICPWSRSMIVQS